MRLTPVPLVIALIAVASLGQTEASKAPPAAKLTFSPMHASIGDVYGLNTMIGRRYPTLVKPLLQRTKYLGTNWIREEITASTLHHATAAPYKFAGYDPVIDQEWAAGYQILGLLDYNNTFGHFPRSYMPHAQIVRFTADYVAFVKAVVSHYRGKILSWQIWNEPDLYHYWRPRVQAADYAYLLTQSYKAIKAIEPKATVVIAGPSGNDPDGLNFLQAVVAAGGTFDVLAAQPYTIVPNQSFIADLQSLQSFKKPIWLTEMGWAGANDCPLCGSEYVQASRLAVGYLLVATNDIQRMFWYDLRDDGLVKSYSDKFGLLSWYLGGKRSFLAYQLSRFVLRNKIITGVAHPTPTVTVWRVAEGSKDVYIALNLGTATDTLKFTWKLPQVRVLDYEGVYSGESSHGTVTLLLGSDRLEYLLPVSMRPKLVDPKGITLPASSKG